MYTSYYFNRLKEFKATRPVVDTVTEAPTHTTTSGAQAQVRYFIVALFSPFCDPVR